MKFEWLTVSGVSSVSGVSLVSDKFESRSLTVSSASGVVFGYKDGVLRER